MLSHPIEAGVSFTTLALNYYLPSFLYRLWDRATTRICADGGGTWVYTFFGDKPFKRPDFVVSDFDSLLPSVRKEFEQKGSKFEFINDLHKCLEVLKVAQINESIIVFGGRLDHTLASFSVALQHSNQRLYFLDDNNFSTWVYPGNPGNPGIICKQHWTTKICGLCTACQAHQDRQKEVGLRLRVQHDDDRQLQQRDRVRRHQHHDPDDRSGSLDESDMNENSGLIASDLKEKRS
jgi:hypothetical protein